MPTRMTSAFDCFIFSLPFRGKSGNIKRQIAPMCDDIRASVTISKRLQTLGGMAASVLAGTGAVFIYAGMLSSYSSWGAVSWP